MTNLQQAAGGGNSTAETEESQHSLWVFVQESVSSAQVFPAAPEQLPDTAGMILDSSACSAHRQQEVRPKTYQADLQPMRSNFEGEFPSLDSWNLFKIIAFFD